MLLFGKNSGRVEYLNFYDIRVDDPENMTYPNDYDRGGPTCLNN